jgi:tRNA (guanine-N7-)-methyltransferase
MAGFANVIQEPQYAPDTPFELRGKWGCSRFANSNPIALELGCGRGEYTVGLAKRCPDMNFIGIDIKGARMWKGAKEALTLNLPNACFLRTRIEMLPRFFAPAEVSQIWLTFPDPQMKDTRKRLTSVSFLERYRTILAPDGPVCLKTDSNFMYRYTLAVIHENSLPIVAAIENIDETDAPDEVTTVRTNYENHWRTLGIAIRYLAFTIPHDRTPLKEPCLEIEKDPYRSRDGVWEG